MSEYQEKRTVVREVPGSRPVVESQYDSSVVHERRGMSGTAVAALIIAVIAAAVVITMLIINNQQRTSDEQLAQERATAQQPVQTAPQSQPQPPIIVTVPQQQPAIVPAPPSQPAAAPAPRTSTEVEIDVTSKLLDDSDLHSYPIDVKVSGGTATLSGQVPSSDLKIRAGKLARTVQGVGSVTNNIVVQP
jgi:BON domain